MIKKIIKNILGKDYETIICDNCGSGLSLGNKKEEKDFLEIHKNCKKEKNGGLGFLKNAENFK